MSLRYYWPSTNIVQSKLTRFILHILWWWDAGQWTYFFGEVDMFGWESIMAETLRAVLETNCHPQSLEDAKYNLQAYDECQKRDANGQDCAI